MFNKKGNIHINILVILIFLACFISIVLLDKSNATQKKEISDIYLVNDMTSNKNDVDFFVYYTFAQAIIKNYNEFIQENTKNIAGTNDSSNNEIKAILLKDTDKTWETHFNNYISEDFYTVLDLEKQTIPTDYNIRGNLTGMKFSFLKDSCSITIPNWKHTFSYTGFKGEYSLPIVINIGWEELGLIGFKELNEISVNCDYNTDCLAKNLIRFKDFSVGDTNSKLKTISMTSKFNYFNYDNLNFVPIKIKFIDSRILSGSVILTS